MEPSDITYPPEVTQYGEAGISVFEEYVQVFLDKGLSRAIAERDVLIAWPVIVKVRQLTITGS